MYKHTQIGWVLLITLGAGILFCFVLGLLLSNWIALSVSGVLIICFILFYSLTVTVNDKFVTVSFGPGLIGKRVRIGDIESCKPVRNRWWYGWGIRKIPRGWLYNVSGLGAAELSMKNGKLYRIGTDEPQRLCEFIRKRLTV